MQFYSSAIDIGEYSSVPEAKSDYSNLQTAETLQL